MSKKPNPFLEKREEKTGKDLDNDGEKGESPTHQKKVLGAKKGKGKGKIPPPAMKNGPMTPMNGKKSKASSGTGSKMCPACMKGSASSCSHL